MKKMKAVSRKTVLVASWFHMVAKRLQGAYGRWARYVIEAPA